jgi:2-amino-4-hydroxy-6-hydroxymethyldihydropteridine diphosphokinase
MADIFLGLGSNQGDKVNNLRKAFDILRSLENFKIKAWSSLYETEPVGVADQPVFVNCVIRAESSMDPHSLLSWLKSVEFKLGREPNTHNRPRPIDIDILLYDDIDMESLELTVPHSRLKGRRFALEPLLEIKPDAVDPATNKPFSEFLAKVKSQKLIKLIDSQEAFNVARRPSEN